VSFSNQQEENIQASEQIGVVWMLNDIAWFYALEGEQKFNMVAPMRGNTCSCFLQASIFFDGESQPKLPFT
jgi:hypothetical protein